LKSYEYLSKVYDELMTDVSYPDWAKYLSILLKENGVLKKSTLLEVGCGTGSISIELKKMGFDLIGLDISEEMLRKAEEKAREAGVIIPFICQDVSEVELHKKVDAVLAVCDVINYIHIDDLSIFFKGIYNALKPNGVLLFDISSLYKLKSILGNNTFFEDSEEMTFIWTNQISDENVIMDITLFIKEGELFRRFDEKHVQFIHSVKMIEKILNKSGFKTTMIYDCFSKNEVNEKSERIQFVAIRA
jgi:2-polyprenyl-3-methyl-5-hydroxy-6-metoxy-1,4-benzoquinol methylase